MAPVGLEELVVQYNKRQTPFPDLVVDTHPVIRRVQAARR